MLKKSSFELAGRHLQRARQKANLSQRQVSEEVGITRLSISRIETGTGADVDNFMRLLMFYHKNKIIQADTLFENVIFEFESDREKVQIEENEMYLYTFNQE